MQLLFFSEVAPIWRKTSTAAAAAIILALALLKCGRTLDQKPALCLSFKSTQRMGIFIIF